MICESLSITEDSILCQYAKMKASLSSLTFLLSMNSVGEDQPSQVHRLLLSSATVYSVVRTISEAAAEVLDVCVFFPDMTWIFLSWN